MFPQGHGYLLSTGYLADANAFFCPSTTVIRQYYSDVNIHRSTEDVRSVGGGSPEAWTYGDYSDTSKAINKHSTLTPSGEGRMWMGAYNYRMTPMVFYASGAGVVRTDCIQPPWASHTYGYGSPGDRHNCGFELVPFLQAFTDSNGCDPEEYKYHVRRGRSPFQSDKQLGSRVMLTDSWSRMWNTRISTSDPTNNKNSQTGKEWGQASQGTYAHRTGYNALYGDLHVAWYGDPQERILYFPATLHYHASTADLAITHQENIDYATDDVNPAYRLWHEFDRAVGEDLRYEDQY